MSDHVTTTGKYPLLERLLATKGLPMKGIWTISDVAQIFNVRNRAIYDWINNQKLTARDLPGRGRFLCEDLEQFLTDSKMPPRRQGGSRGQQ